MNTAGGWHWIGMHLIIKPAAFRVLDDDSQPCLPEECDGGDKGAFLRAIRIRTTRQTDVSNFASCDYSMRKIQLDRLTLIGIEKL